MSGGPQVPVREAVRTLKRAILSCPGDVLSQTDTETRDFLYSWLKNNKADYSRNIYTPQVETSSNLDGHKNSKFRIIFSKNYANCTLTLG